MCKKFFALEIVGYRCNACLLQAVGANANWSDVTIGHLSLFGGGTASNCGWFAVALRVTSSAELIHRTGQRGEWPALASCNESASVRWISSQSGSMYASRTGRDLTGERNAALPRRMGLDAWTQGAKAVSPPLRGAAKIRTFAYASDPEGLVAQG
jgi:hypothetical protein